MGSSGTGAYENLIQLGLESSVAQQLDDLITEGYFPPEGYANDVAVFFRGIDQPTLNNILVQYKGSDFTGVADFGALLIQVAKQIWNKSANVNNGDAQNTSYFKQDTPMDNQQSYTGPPAAPEQSGGYPMSMDPASSARPTGATSDRMQRILDRTGYKYEATSGQRSYGPGPGYEDFKPPKNSQCYFGKIPYEYQVEDLVELFEKAGTIYHMRLMMNPETGKNQTYGFVTFLDSQTAQNCVQMFDNYEVTIPNTNRKRRMVVKISEPNRRLFVGPVPKSKSKDDIWTAFASIVDGIEDVIVHEPAEPGNTAKNKGFCFIDFVDHKSATQAKKRLDPGNIPIQAWRNFTGYGTDWADPLDEPDEETMSKVKNLYITKLTENVTDTDLQERFSQYGNIERVKKVNNYAFVHFLEREDCMKALEAEDGKPIKDSVMKVALAKPVSQEGKNRMQQMKDRRGGPGGFGGPRGGRGGFGFGRGGPQGYPSDYGYADDYGYDQYGYGSYGYGGYDQSRAYGSGYGGADPYAAGYGYDAYGGRGGGHPYGPPHGFQGRGAPYGGHRGGPGVRGGRGGAFGDGFGGRGGFQGDKRTFGGRGGPPPKRGRGGF